MITAKIIEYYANLLILQYLQKPKAFNTVEALVAPVIMNQLPIDVRDAFDIETAQGVQLDVLGKYAGVTRSGNGFIGPITLDDSDFISLIRLAIIHNNAGSSLAEIQALLHTWFPGQILVFDYADMTMDYLVDSSVGSFDLAQLFITEGLLPKPMGVQLKATIYGPFASQFFGFRTYEYPGFNISPFNDYNSYQMDFPWLDYRNAIIPP